MIVTNGVICYQYLIILTGPRVFLISYKKDYAVQVAKSLRLVELIKCMQTTKYLTALFSNDIFVLSSINKIDVLLP